MSTTKENGQNTNPNSADEKISSSQLGVKKTDPPTKEERQNLLLRFIDDNSSSSQQKMSEYLEKKTGSFISQSTINRDLRELGYIKINGSYTKSVKKRMSEQQVMLRSLMVYEQPKIYSSKTDIFQLIIGTKKGSEEAIAKLISQIYENNIIGTIVGNGCVIVLTSVKKNADEITKIIREYRN